MIVVAQAGQFGKTRLLFEMHRLRKQVFHDRLKWPVTVSPEGIESDQFDLPDAVYLLSITSNGKVVGTWRLLPTTGPTMIRDVWPQFTETLPMPTRKTVWEVSRFAVNPEPEQGTIGKKQISTVTAELFCGLTELCLYAGIEQIFTLYDARIARVVSRLNCRPTELSDSHLIDGFSTRIGAFKTNDEMLLTLQKATGIYQPLLDYGDLPPAIEILRENLHSNHSDRKLMEAFV